MYSFSHTKICLIGIDKFFFIQLLEKNFVAEISSRLREPYDA